MTADDGGVTRSRADRLSRSVGLRYAVVFLLALGARAGWGTYRLVRAADATGLEFPDESDYWSLAGSLAHGDGLVGEHGFRALRMPLFPAWLSLLAARDDGVVHAKIAMWVIGAASAVLAAELAGQAGGWAVGLIAGLAVAFDPFLVFFSSLLLTEAPFITALLGLWVVGWPLIRPGRRHRVGRWFALGCLCSICIYTRESSALLCGLWIVLLVACRRFDRPAVTGGGLAVLLVVGSLVPWAARNASVTGDWCWLTHRGGISLYDGVGPQATGASDLGAVKQMPSVRGLDEAAWDRWFWRRSLSAMRADPVRMLRLAAVKIARTWNPVPNVETYRSMWIRLLSAAWTLPVYILSVLGVARLARRDIASAVALLLPAAYVFILHALFVGSVRYRLPAMPFLEMLAAIGLAAGFRFQRARPVPGSR